MFCNDAFWGGTLPCTISVDIMGIPMFPVDLDDKTASVVKRVISSRMVIF